MNNLSNETAPLDETIWREWVHKGRLREQFRARRRRKVAGIVAVLAAVASMLLYLRTGT